MTVQEKKTPELLSSLRLVAFVTLISYLYLTFCHYILSFLIRFSYVFLTALAPGNASPVLVEALKQ